MRYVVKLWIAGLGAAALGTVGRFLVPTSRPLILAAISLSAFALGYAVFTVSLRIPEALMLASKLRRRAGV